MKAIAEHDIRAVPYFAVSFFAGIRPEAVMKMKWGDVSQNGYLYVPHVANKTGHAYNTKIIPTLAEWLEWWDAKGNERSGYIWPLSETTLKRVRKVAMKNAGIQTWITDGARKTFATAHRTTFNCKVLTSGALGHKGTTVLDEYYDSRLMTPEEASSYWEISPNVVHQNNGGPTL
jgi:integrase